MTLKPHMATHGGMLRGDSATRIGGPIQLNDKTVWNVKMDNYGNTSWLYKQMARQRFRQVLLTTPNALQINTSIY